MDIRARGSGNKKEQIYQSSKKLFYEQGFSKTTIRQIAADSGSNVALLHYYFNSKDELGVQIYDDVRTEIRNMSLTIYSKPDVPLHMIMLSFSTDMCLLLKSGEYRELYLSVASSSAMEQHIQKQVDTILPMVTTDTSDARLNAALFPGMKATLLKLDREAYPFTDREIVLFYMIKYFTSLHMSEPFIRNNFASTWDHIERLDPRIVGDYHLEFDRDYLASVAGRADSEL